MVSVEGIEPSILSAAELKSDVYASSTTRPNIKAAIYTCRAASPRSEVYIIRDTLGLDLSEALLY